MSKYIWRGFFATVVGIVMVAFLSLLIHAYLGLILALAPTP